jgi:hypothetical protein
VLIAVIPGLGQFLATKAKFSAVQKDLWVSRMTGLAGVIGSLVIAFAPSVPVLMIGDWPPNHVIVSPCLTFHSRIGCLRLRRGHGTSNSESAQQYGRSTPYGYAELFYCGTSVIWLDSSGSGIVWESSVRPRDRWDIDWTAICLCGCSHLHGHCYCFLFAICRASPVPRGLARQGVGLKNNYN